MSVRGERLAGSVDPGWWSTGINARVGLSETPPFLGLVWWAARPPGEGEIPQPSATIGGFQSPMRRLFFLGLLTTVLSSAQPAQLPVTSANTKTPAASLPHFED